jgi:hypothetical protein
MAGEDVDLVPSRFAARTIGSLAEVRIGCEVWSRENLEGRMDRFGDALGGIVVATDGGGRFVTDDGEVIDRPARFHCYNPYTSLNLAFVWLAEDQVDPERIGVVKETVLTNAVRRFASEVCQHSHQLRSLSSWEADLMRYAFVLSAVIMGQR